MKLFYLATLLVWIAQIPAPPQKPTLDVNEITSQLGLCNANLSIEQRYTRALQVENADLRKQLATLSKINIPEGHMPAGDKK